MKNLLLLSVALILSVSCQKKDQVVSIDDSKRAIGLYDNASLHIIEGAGHGFKPEEFEESLEQIKDFLLYNNE